MSNLRRLQDPCMSDNVWSMFDDVFSCKTKAQDEPDLPDEKLYLPDVKSCELNAKYDRMYCDVCE